MILINGVNFDSIGDVVILGLKSGFCLERYVFIFMQMCFWTSSVGMPTNLVVDIIVPLVLKPDMVEKCSGQ